jgi:hypothetical protein
MGKEWILVSNKKHSKGAFSRSLYSKSEFIKSSPNIFKINEFLP